MTREPESPERLFPTPLETFLQATKGMPLVGDNYGLDYHSALETLVKGNHLNSLNKFKKVRLNTGSQLLGRIKSNRAHPSQLFNREYFIKLDVEIMRLLGLDQLEGKAGEGAKKLIAAAEAEIQKIQALRDAMEREIAVPIEKPATPEPIIPEPVKVEDQSEDQRLKEQQRREWEFMEKVLSQGDCLLSTSTRPAGVDYIFQSGKGSSGILKDWSILLSSEDSAVSVLGALWKKKQNVGIYNVLNEAIIPEVAVIRPLKKDVHGIRRVRKTEIKKGFLGRNKQVEMEVDEDFVSGQVPLTLKEAIGTDSDEEAFTLQYSAGHLQHAYIRTDIPSYRDGWGRSGNVLDFSVVMPKSLAFGVEGLVRDNPTFVRDLVLWMISKKYSRQFNDQVMRTYGTPPFEAWEKYHQPRMYFVDVLANPPQDKNQGLDSFDPSKIIRFNTKTVDGYKFAVRR